MNIFGGGDSKKNKKSRKKDKSRKKERKSRKKEHIIPQVKRKKQEASEEEGIQSSFAEDMIEKKKINEKGLLGWIKSFVQTTPKGKKPSVKDPGKKRRIVILASLNVALVFGLKIWKPQEWRFDQAILLAALSSVITYLGLIWCLRFDVSRRALTRVLPQAALFSFGSALFLVLFFFGKFERLYESLIFIIFLTGYLVLMIMVFLTTNILSVATVKKIPLFRAGQTASYAITLITIFFVTFSFISSTLPIYFLALILLPFFILATWLHLSHFSFKDNVIIWYCVGISWASLLVLLGFLFWPVSGLLASFIPVSIVYFGLGAVMYHIGKASLVDVVWELGIFSLVAILIIMFRARWGIGGAFWM
jgi:hypothetical protein